MPTGGRKTHLQAIHQISQRLLSSSPLSGVIGVAPAGAIMGQVHALVLGAFNSTTNTLAVGVTPGGAQILAPTDLKTVGRTDIAVPLAGAAAGPYAVDTPIYWTLAFTGAAPTAGNVTVVLDYLPGPG